MTWSHDGQEALRRMELLQRKAHARFLRRRAKYQTDSAGYYLPQGCRHD
jgi:hypothetical protein